MNRHEFLIYCELYKRKEFDKIPIGKYPNGSYFYMTPKQIELCHLLADDHTIEIGYGGSARSGKTIIESTVIIFDSFCYPGIGWGLGRKELVILKKTVLMTFHRQLDFYGITDKDYRFDGELNIFTFTNGSEVFLINTDFKPSDNLNTRFGSFELTRCAVDESNETAKSVIEKLFERIGWRKNDTYGLKRKLLECFNPAKNHVYTRYYKPYRDKKETKQKRFIPALPTDNPNPVVKEWIDDMLASETDKTTIQRQVYGNFEYDDDPSALVDYDALCDMFTNTHVQPGKKKISSDLAMQGRDRFLAIYWEGLIGKLEIDKEKADGKEIETDLTELKNTRGVGNTAILADADGLGNYLSSYIKNISEFRGGARPQDPQKYDNLKSECAWQLAEAINKRQIYIICTEAQQERIKEEVSICLKRANLDGDTQKRKLISKEDMKKLLGHSPDYLDVLLMGMWQGKREKKGMKAL